MIPENKVFLITGASSGIGKEISILLSKEKCSLALLARRTELLNQLSEQLPLLVLHPRKMQDRRALQEVQGVVAQ